MKKLLCVFLSILMLLGQMSLPVFAEETEEVKEYPDELIASSVTALKGDFFTEMFGNATSDIDVRALIHGYNLVHWDENQGTYILDPTVVTDVLVTQDEDGNKTYTLVLADDLYYSDGTPITAWDYAFSLLLMMSPEIEAIGGKIYRAEHILGYNNYIQGRIKAMNGEPIPRNESALGGVRVIDDHQIMITLDHEFLPYFFETGLLLTVPYPISVIAPGCKVYDDGYGIYIGNTDQNSAEPVYNAELLKKTILDPETGYNSHPAVVSGPYVLTSFDGVTARFEKNEYYKGFLYHKAMPTSYLEQMPIHFEPLLDLEGNQLLDVNKNPMYIVQPNIEKIAFTLADNDTVIEQLGEGTLHLVNKVTYGKTILEGLQAGGENGVTSRNYPRIGLAFATFTYDWPTVHDKEVRQAIAWCMDRDSLTAKYCGDEESGMTFGVRVDGYYGIEQWEYLLVNHSIDFPVVLLEDGQQMVQTADGVVDLTKKYKYRYVTTQADYEAAIEAWEALSLDPLTVYEVDLEKANKLLDDAGWKLNRNGEKYVAGTDDVRCKEIDGELVALDLSMMYPEGNHMAEYMQEEGMFIDNLAKVGIKMTLVPASMTDLLASYYRETERTTDMIYLATNFHVVVDPSITYSADSTANHKIWNNTYSDDEELWNRAVDMRKTEPDDDYVYVAKWIEFQERYNDVLPTIPIYSNIYFDFFNEDLQNYYPDAHVTWSQAILMSYFGEPIEIPEEEEVEGDTVSFDD